ncbi:MAG: hypothetical protein AB1714_04455 [Acidobacteriota bacterium]
MLEKTIEEGGATDKTDTIYQIIAVPRELTMWIRAPENFTWQEVKLARIFD